MLLGEHNCLLIAPKLHKQSFNDISTEVVEEYNEFYSKHFSNYYSSITYIESTQQNNRNYIYANIDEIPLDYEETLPNIQGSRITHIRSLPPELIQSDTFDYCDCIESIEDPSSCYGYAWLSPNAPKSKILRDKYPDLFI